MQLIKYCGLLINTQRAQYEVATSRLNFFKEMLRSPQQFSKQAWGYLAFWIYALGMSSIVRLLNFASHHILISILESGLWPLPRPPERIWASDASKQFIAVVAPTQLIFRGCAFGEHIFENKLLGAFVAAFFGPNSTAILCNNTAVIGATTSKSNWLSAIAIATAILRACKDLKFWYIASKYNPADHPSRCIKWPCLQQVCESVPAVLVHLEHDWVAMTKSVISLM